MNTAFTSRAIESREPIIQSIVDRLLDAIAPTGQTDLIADFAYPLPAAVIAGMLGASVDDLDRIKRWSDDLAAFVGSALATPDNVPVRSGPWSTCPATFTPWWPRAGPSPGTT